MLLGELIALISLTLGPHDLGPQFEGQTDLCCGSLGLCLAMEGAGNIGGKGTCQYTTEHSVWPISYIAPLPAFAHECISKQQGYTGLLYEMPRTTD